MEEDLSCTSWSAAAFLNIVSSLTVGAREKSINNHAAEWIWH
jgi:hypothetical protein